MRTGQRQAIRGKDPLAADWRLGCLGARSQARPSSRGSQKRLTQLDAVTFVTKDTQFYSQRDPGPKANHLGGRELPTGLHKSCPDLVHLLPRISRLLPVNLFKYW